MTRYLTLRTHDTGGSVHYPKAVDCDWQAPTIAYTPSPLSDSQSP